MLLFHCQLYTDIAVILFHILDIGLCKLVRSYKVGLSVLKLGFDRLKSVLLGWLVSEKLSKTGLNQCKTVLCTVFFSVMHNVLLSISCIVISTLVMFL